MPQQDVLHRFLFEELGIRGLWVRLAQSWQTAQLHQKAPVDVQLQLGQALTAAVLLSATIKFNGSLILQAQGNGAIKTLVAQATHDRKIRGLVIANNSIHTDNFQKLFGDGRLVITVAPDKANTYQGIVPLTGDNMAMVLENYFIHSEQLNTKLWLFADTGQTSGLLIQELPSHLNDNTGWERVAMLANTVTEHELQALDCEEMLYRLFHEEKVRLYDSEVVTFDCSCSRLKIENALRLIGREELDGVLNERGQIEVNCEFCNKQYRFDRIDVEHLLRQAITPPNDPELRH